MRKILLSSILFIAGISILSGCTPQQPLDYNGKTYEVHRLEEVLEDILEDQNEGRDLEVRIIEEQEDD